ncbi:MAG: glycosyltransferase family 2 protein [Psychrobium sp.]
MKVGFITVLYNNVDVLEDFFRSVSIQVGVNYTLYVIDNSDGDDVIIAARILANEHSVKSVFYKSEYNCGVAKGNNIGIELALSDDCEAICLINNDLIFDEPTVFKKLLSKLENNDLVSPYIKAYPSKDWWFTEGYFDLVRGTTPHSGCRRKSNIPYAPTCCLMVKREVFERIGLMDEWYFAYYDDSDFVYRAYQHGFKLDSDSENIIYHKVSSSTGGAESDFSIYYGNRNRVYFIRKKLRKTLPLLYTLGTRFLMLLSRRTVKQKKLIIKAIRDGFRA